MFKYNFNLKYGAAKARMCMAACVTASTLTLGFTSKAAAMPEEDPMASFRSCKDAFITSSSMVTETNKLARVKIKVDEGVEKVLQEAERKAKELEEQREAEKRRREEEQAAAQSFRAAAISGGGYDKELLASIIFCEAGNQSFEGQVAVGAVIMNRIASSAYPNTIEGVIYQPGQFGPAGSGWLDQIRSTAGYTASAMQAAEAALAGQNPIGGCLYFDQGGYGIQIGAHFFH